MANPFILFSADAEPPAGSASLVQVVLSRPHTWAILPPMPADTGLEHWTREALVPLNWGLSVQCHRGDRSNSCQVRLLSVSTAAQRPRRPPREPVSSL